MADGLRRDEPCARCSIGLYCIEAHAPSQRFAALPKDEQLSKAPPCKIRPHMKCQGAMDIYRYTDAEDT